MLLHDFNALPEDQAHEIVGVWARIPSWADAVIEARPYESVDALAAQAQISARAWTTADLDAAMAHHPRIGENPEGEGAEARASRDEQAAMQHADGSLAQQIATRNREYENRFGRVFLIRAAGRAPAEILAELNRRLGNDDAAETREAREQLAQIAELRLRASVVEETSEETR